MKIFKFFGKIFNFGLKYRKEEEKYHSESYKFGPVGHLINITLMALFPLLCLLGAWIIPWGNTWLFKVLCLAATFTVFTTTAELFIYGIVALRHRVRMKIQNKVEDKIAEGISEAITGAEITDEQKQKLEQEKAKGTHDKMDLAIGIISIVLSVLVLLAWIGINVGFIWFYLSGTAK